MKSIKTCPGCGARLTVNMEYCDYCGNPVTGNDNYIRKKNTAIIDFGFNYKYYLVVFITAAGIGSLIASLMDSDSFFSNDISNILWFFVLPAFSLLTGTLKRISKRELIIIPILFLATGTGFAVPNIFRLQTGFWNDILGAGALIGGISAAAYLTGIFIHRIICFYKSK